MAGNRRTGVVLQDRDRHLLSELGTMRIIDRELTKVVAGFGSTRRANDRLLRLTRGGILSRFFVGSVAAGRKPIYTLTKKGAEISGAQFDGLRRGANRLIVGDRFVDHQMAINEIYVQLKYRLASQSAIFWRRWHSFRSPISESIKLTPDGYVELQINRAVRAMFLEVDLGTEALRVFDQKTAYYLQLAVSGEFQKLFRQAQFRVLVITSSERRLQHLRAGIAKKTDKVFWLTTFEDIHREGFWSAVWLRPAGDQKLSLL